MKGAVLTMVLIVLSVTASADPIAIDAPVVTDVCSVLAHPAAFAGKEITLRGFVFLGMDHMNVSDRNCPGHGIELVVDDEATFNRPDIQGFYKALNKFGRQGMATLTGRFVIAPDSPTPNMLHIHHAKDEMAAK